MSVRGIIRSRLGSASAILISRQGVAAIELALVAPILLALFGAFVDFGMLLRNRIAAAEAVANVDNYAFATMNAGQSAIVVESSAITTAASSIATLFGTGSSAAVSFNNGFGASTRCCPRLPSGDVWNCGVSMCSDGTDPGVFLKVTITFTFKPLLPEDAFLAGSYVTAAISRVL